MSKIRAVGQAMVLFSNLFDDSSDQMCSENVKGRFFVTTSVNQRETFLNLFTQRIFVFSPIPLWSLKEVKIIDRNTS